MPFLLSHLLHTHANTSAVWALYPESNQRTLEEMDMLFAADTPWTWDAERNFARLKEENPGMMLGYGGRRTSVTNLEEKRHVSVEKVELSLS